MRGQLSEALRIINCLRALARVFMIQRKEADVPEMVTEPGKWLDGHTLFFLEELLRHDTSFRLMKVDGINDPRIRGVHGHP